MDEVDVPADRISRERVLKKLDALSTEARREVLFELQKLADSGALQRERVAIVNDKYDVYIFEPSPPASIVVISDPGTAKHVLADLDTSTPTPRQAAEIGARAIGEIVKTIYLPDRS